LANSNQSNLKGVRVFVVEDEFAVLMLLEDMLMELGCELVGSASRMPEAISGAQNSGCDAAVLDVNINGEPIDPVAEVLAARQVPMVFSTGYGRTGINVRWRGHPVLQKPYRVEELAAALTQALADRAPA
jgi:CheY-like chemotaxis protein